MDIIIKNIKTPILIKNTLKWELLNWNLNKWKDILSSEELIFYCGKKGFTSEPQFDYRINGDVEMTFEEFLNSKTKSEWSYFSYKHLKDWLVNCEELRSHITWNDFGFPELNVEDSTIWIGSKGAHTPCHVDTYGCNIVAQIYGRKRWMLFPPGEDLESTRIPYEESSIFSKINFFAPSVANCKAEKNCYSVVLHPGDVLVVPHRWWHYVENLELAISINTWIKLPVDYEERVKEAIVRASMKQYLKDLNPDIQKRFLTSNAETNTENFLQVLLVQNINEEELASTYNAVAVDNNKSDTSPYIDMLTCQNIDNNDQERCLSCQLRIIQGMNTCKVCRIAVHKNAKCSIAYEGHYICVRCLGNILQTIKSFIEENWRED